MTIEEQIARIVERIRAMWGVGTSLAFVYVIVELPLWVIPIFFVFSVGTYFAALYIAGIYLALVINPEDHSTREVIVPENLEGFFENGAESIGIKLGKVINTGEVFGHYLDQPMFEWVDICVDTQGQSARYVFEQVTLRDEDGNLLLSQEEGFAHYLGVTYKLALPG